MENIENALDNVRKGVHSLYEALNAEGLNKEAKDTQEILKKLAQIKKVVGEKKEKKVVEPPKEGHIVVYAFTGLKLAELEIRDENETEIVVEAKNGNRLVFNKFTGMQVNAKNPRFANRISPVA